MLWARIKDGFKGIFMYGGFYPETLLPENVHQIGNQGRKLRVGWLGRGTGEDRRGRRPHSERFCDVALTV